MHRLENGYDYLNVKRRAFLQPISDSLPEKAVISTR